MSQTWCYLSYQPRVLARLLPMGQLESLGR